MKHAIEKMAIVLGGAVLALAACTNRPLVKVEPQTESYVMEAFKQAEIPPVDILVVVDDSLSMREEQNNLAEEFPALIRNLLDPPIDPETGELTHLPVEDMHIGVISTDMGTGGYSVGTCDDPIDGEDGILQHQPNPSMPGCDGSYPSYLSYLSDTPDVERVEKMATDFGCVAVLGTDGCGFEQQLKAARKALIDHAGGANAGFVRTDSLLTILFVTDEEDCSVAAGHEAIFDEMRTDLGHINLRCFAHPYMVEQVDGYIEAFRSLRDPDRLVMGFIVGVPQGLVCEGAGDEIDGCLDVDIMHPRPDDTGTKLAPACVSDDGDASPGRRYVEIAQQIGENALVSSICAESFEPAIRGLTAMLAGAIKKLTFARELEIDKDPDNDCRCVATCNIIEEYPDSRECPADRPCFEPAGEGTGCAFKEQEDGTRHSLCVIPQAGTLIDNCALSCTDPAAVHTPAGEGWYYLPYGAEGRPAVIFSESMVPAEGTQVYIQCESMICPENRQCGPVGFEGSMCCDQDAFCDRAAPGGPTCTSRPD